MKNLNNFYKKILIILTICTINLPATFATCAIDEITESCSIAQFRQREFEPTFSTQPAIDYNDTPETRLKPSKNLVEETLREFRPNPADFNYNSSCQFGVCNTGGSDPLFLNR